MQRTEVFGHSYRWDRPYVMGVLNVTPDSFSDGGRFFSLRDAVARGLAMADQGADILDVGGESTRPGASPVPAGEELRRVIPVIRELVGACKAQVSVDTYKAEVAQQAVEAGAAWINDVSGLSLDPELASVAARSGAGLILGHMRGDPRTMQSLTDYDDCVADVTAALASSVDAAVRAGVPRGHIIVDPGIGFGKTAEQNLDLMLASGRISASLGLPVLVGPSRKAFIGVLTGAPVESRLAGTLAACTASILAGAHMVRVHDVAEARQAVDLAWSMAGRLEKGGGGLVAGLGPGLA